MISFLVKNQSEPRSVVSSSWSDSEILDQYPNYPVLSHFSSLPAQYTLPDDSSILLHSHRLISSPVLWYTEHRASRILHVSHTESPISFPPLSALFEDGRELRSFLNPLYEFSEVTNNKPSSQMPIDTGTTSIWCLQANIFSSHKFE